jgi:hypothetical protein
MYKPLSKYFYEINTYLQERLMTIIKLHKAEAHIVIRRSLDADNTYVPVIAITLTNMKGETLFINKETGETTTSNKPLEGYYECYEGCYDYTIVDAIIRLCDNIEKYRKDK